MKKLRKIALCPREMETWHERGLMLRPLTCPNAGTPPHLEMTGNVDIHDTTEMNAHIGGMNERDLHEKDIGIVIATGETTMNRHIESKGVVSRDLVPSSDKAPVHLICQNFSN